MPDVRQMKRALVCGAGGFIGWHLTNRLKADGFWVRGVDVHEPYYARTAADHFSIGDLRQEDTAKEILAAYNYDEVYQLAADMGGMGYIHSAECEIMRNSALININMISAAGRYGVGRYLFSSSACVYRDMQPHEPEMDEESAYPAMPDNQYGWEKLYAERMAMTYGNHYRFPVKIARFQNCYGPYGTWRGGREKAPAALCRKVAEAKPGDHIQVWGDGKAMRAYTYIDDMVEGIVQLMRSELRGPTDIGSREYVSVEALAQTIIATSGKEIGIDYVRGPVGVAARNFKGERIASLGWQAKTNLADGIAKTYAWVADQVKNAHVAYA